MFKVKPTIIAIDVARDLIKDTVFYSERLLNEGVNELKVLFPNRRAVRFFEKFLSPQAFFKVTALSLPDFLKNMLYSRLSNPPLYQHDIDRYFMILDIIKNRIPSLFKKLGDKEDRVFPWCIRLSSLFNDFDRELIQDVKQIEYVDNVVDEAKEILYQIDTLYEAYRENIEKDNLTFSGDLFRRVGELDFRENSVFLISGFASVSKSEKRIFDKMLATTSSLVIFQTDLENRHGKFNPYSIYNKWLDGSYWGQVPEKIKQDGDFAKTKLKFFESFDVHSSCLQFGDKIQTDTKNVELNSNPLNTGVVLPDENSLIPVICSLPNNNVNITMGFPFSKSTFAKILNGLIELSLTYSEKGYYYKPLLKLVNHPIISGVKFGTKKIGKLGVKLATYIEKENIAFIKFNNLQNSTVFTDNEIDLIKLLDKQIFEKFINARSLNEIGVVFKDLLLSVQSYLVNSTGLNLERQMAVSFADNVLTKLMEAKSSKIKFSSTDILYRILKSITEELSIKFEGNPLVGTQIMGMLEARMLKFNTLHILDVNEGILPPDNKIDPLIPGTLKKEIGLPGYKEIEDKYKYYFFRLIDSCENVNIYYQKGETTDEKKIRSRFVEQLLFQIELEQVKTDEKISVKEMEKALINSTSVQITSKGKQKLFEKTIKRCEINFKNKAISASAINSYMSCPLRYYLTNILKIEEENKIAETQDPRNVGTIIHKLLEDGFRKLIGSELEYKQVKQVENQLFETLDSILEQELKQLSGLRINLLKQTAKYRLKSFFAKTYSDLKEHSVTVLSVEKELTTIFNNQRITGIIDRIDYVNEQNNGHIRVVDYKTGAYALTPSKKLGEFIDTFNFPDFTRENQESLFKKLVSIQLPLYNYLLDCSSEFEVVFEDVNSILYLLGVGKSEEGKAVFEGKNLSVTKFEKILDYILKCMESADNYYFVDSDKCGYCPHFKTCLFTTHKESIF